MFQKVFLKETWKVQPFRGDTFYGLALPTFQLCVHPLRIFSHSTSKVRKNALLEIAKNLIFLKIKLCILSEQSDSYYKQKHTLKSTNLFQNDSISSYLFTFEIIFDMYYVCYDNWTQLNARHRTAGKSQNINHILNLQCDTSHIYVYFDADFFFVFWSYIFLIALSLPFVVPFYHIVLGKNLEKSV